MPQFDPSEKLFQSQAHPIVEHEPGQLSREPDNSPAEPWGVRIVYLAMLAVVGAVLIAGLFAFT